MVIDGKIIKKFMNIEDIFLIADKFSASMPSYVFVTFIKKSAII